MPPTDTPTQPSPQDQQARYWNSGYSVVNNTAFLLDIVQDGQVIARRLKPGQVLPLRSLWFQRISNVSAIGFESDGTYVGTDAFIFTNVYPQTWTVTGLVPQGGRW